MSNWAPINAKPEPIHRDNSDASSSERPTGQSVATDASSYRSSSAMDTDDSRIPTPPVSHSDYNRTLPIIRPVEPIPWQPGPPHPYRGRDHIKANVLNPFHTRTNSSCRQSGPPVSNRADNLASPSSVSAIFTQDPMGQWLQGPGPRPAYRENARTCQNSEAYRPRNSRCLKAGSELEAYELNTRHLVRLISPQADGLVHRLLTEHKPYVRQSHNGSAASAINESAWKLILETAMEELKVPICRLSTIGRALKDVYTESEFSEEEKHSDHTLCCIKDLLYRIEQTLPLFADIHQIELALAGLRLKRVGLGSADPNRTYDRSRQSLAYPDTSLTRLGPDPPPPGRGLRRVDCEADEGKTSFDF